MLVAGAIAHQDRTRPLRSQEGPLRLAYRFSLTHQADEKSLWSDYLRDSFNKRTPNSDDLRNLLPHGMLQWIELAAPPFIYLYLYLELEHPTPRIATT
jgi:hypothetical protein